MARENPPLYAGNTTVKNGSSWGVEPKIGRILPPKMDGENKGSKPYEQMDDLGGFTPIFGSTPISHSY